MCSRNGRCWSMASLGWAVVPEVVHRIATSVPRPCAISASKRPGSAASEPFAGIHQPVPGDQAWILVLPHAAIVTVDDQARPAGTQLEQLVDLLLVLAQDDPDVRRLQQVAGLGGQHVLVDAQRQATQGLGGKLAPDPVRPVAADQAHHLATPQPKLGQAQRHEPHLVAILRPGELVPDAELLLAHGHFAGPVRGIVQEQLGQRVQVGEHRQTGGAQPAPSGIGASRATVMIVTGPPERALCDTLTA